MSDDTTQQPEAKPVDQVAEIQAQQKAADDERAKANVTTDAISATHHISLTEHAMGSRQPDNGTYDSQRQPAPLSGMDIPQVMVTAKNDTPTPGENNV